MIDLVKITSGGEHPVTYGDAERSEDTGKYVPKETTLTGKEDHCSLQRIDCIRSLKRSLKRADLLPTFL